MARRFRFRLEVVRKVRQQAQDEQRRVVAEHARAVNVSEELIRRFSEQLRMSLNSTRDSQQTQNMDLPALRGDQLHRGWLHREIMTCHEDMAKQKDALEEERSKLAEATKRVKVLDKLREKHWGRHLADLQKEEQAAYDEMAVQSYIRRNSDLLLEVTK